ncbi:MAG TPA: hypothetical protein VL282_10335, partial [Tepidisphaeraceae bacterium]|nr:hypothetical protein [Tepidisphaeraceae bacterium]
RLNVYNLSDMTRDEAEQLVSSREGRLCVRYCQRTDGGVVTRDCKGGLRKRAVIAATIAASASIAFLAAALSAAGMSFGPSRYPSDSSDPADPTPPRGWSRLFTPPPVVNQERLGKVAITCRIAPVERPVKMGEIAPRAIQGDVMIPPTTQPTTQSITHE